MFKRTLIVVEPHPDLDSVIRHGAAMAQSCAGEIVFYTGLSREGSLAADTPFVEDEARPNWLENLRYRAEQLHRQARQVAEDIGIPSRSMVVASDDPVKDILSAAQSHRCDAIMLVSSGGNAVSRLFNGSCVPRLVSSSFLPLLVYPAATSHATPAGVSMGRLLVNLEEGDVTEVARRVGIGLARDLAAELLFVHITPSDLAPAVDAAGFVAVQSEQMAVEIQMQSRRLLNSAIAAGEKAALTARGLILPGGTTARDIARLGVEQACDLIVVAHRSSSAVMRLLFGSLIPGLITAAEIPILICREPDRLSLRRTPRRRHHRLRAAAAAAAARAAQDRDH